MDIGIVSVRYAKALMKYAQDTKTEDSVYACVRMLEHSFQNHADLHAALDNPILTIREKYSLISTAAAGDAPVSHELSRFITLVLKNGRESMLRYLCLAFLDLYRKSKHIGVAKLITAVPVTKEEEERIRNSASTLLHARMELQTEVDPSVLGGFIFDVNNFRLDASIATQLKKVKEQFIDNNRRIV